LPDRRSQVETSTTIDTTNLNPSIDLWAMVPDFMFTPPVLENLTADDGVTFLTADDGITILAAV